MKLFKKKVSTPNPVPMESPMERRVTSRKKGFRHISSTVVLLVAAPLLALFITAHVFHSYEVDGLSMSTTLQHGDRLIVNKLSKTISNLKGSVYMPSRGDIIVFDRPRQISAPNSVKHLIKRVIALPGERVTVRDGKVTVYNIDQPNGFDPDKDKEYSEDIVTTHGNVDVTVSLGEVFVMGDNRTNSSDSRVFGPINTSTIVGDATLRFIPTSKMRRF